MRVRPHLPCVVANPDPVEPGMERRDPSLVGDLVRRHRLAAALSQEALAERAGLSVRAIGDLERGIHQLPRLETLRMLAGALGLADTGRAELLAAARPQTSAPVPRAHVRSHPAAVVPVPPTRLIGRETEVAAIAQVLAQDEVRLVTLTGPGGTGKTRLALAVAAVALTHYPDGVCFVDLSPLRDPALVVPTIAAVLGVQAVVGQSMWETLAAFLAEKHLLLVIDNFEHLLDAAPEIAGLVAACANLSVLTTSREPLHVRAEREVAVLPLPFPDPLQALSREELAIVPAVALFIERARAANARFAVTDENAAAIAAICQRLDGLPLAIELAAVRMKAISPEGLLSRFGTRLPLLTGGARDLPARQRTLRETIAWSFDLLAPNEQTLLRQLAVFAGGWTLDAAEEVMRAYGEGDVLGGLTSLVDKSLVWLDHHPVEPRYRMLETVREFAWGELQQANEVDWIRARHAAWVRALADQMASAFERGPVTPYWPTRIAAEIDNIRAALVWLDESGEVDALLGLTAALWGFWRFGGYRPEARRWVMHALALPGTQGSPARLRALLTAATMFEDLHENTEALALAHEALRLAEQDGDSFDQGLALVVMSMLANARGAYEDAEQLVRLGMAKFDEPRHSDWIAGLIQISAIAAYGRGDFELAQMRFEESLRRHREFGETWLTARAFDGLARVALQREDAQAAARFLSESLPLHREFPTQEATIAWLTPLASLAVLGGSMTNAALLLGAGTALRGMLDLSLPYPDRAEVEVATRAARSALGESTFTATWEEGRALSLGDAVRIAERVLTEISAAP
jgi:predicted ATPase/transcriptional regulator with XRE-family HTH domain